jgi:prevent-host-death family protein
MKAIEAGIFEVKTHLSEFIEKVAQGQTFVITKRGKPVAELRPPEKKIAPRPKLGRGRGTEFYMAPDFDEPLEDLKDYL